MTATMPYTYPGDYGWTRHEAIRAAHADSNYLISPTARSNAFQALTGDHTPLADAARVILHDGGAQQGTRTPRGYPCIPARMNVWRDADDILTLWCREQGRDCPFCKDDQRGG